jgi:hypothetical protein
MTEGWKLPWTGGCRCDRTRFEVTAAPLLAAACHCTGCQRMTAVPYSLSIAVPTEGFRVTRGEPVIGGLHGASRHFHCAHCLSWMFTRPEGLDWLVNVRAPMLDDHAWFVPYVELFTSEGLPWARTPAPHSYPTMPGPEVFQELIAGFAREGVRPG